MSLAIKRLQDNEGTIWTLSEMIKCWPSADLIRTDKTVYLFVACPSEVMPDTRKG